MDPHDTAMDDWRRNAAEHDDRNYEFLRSLKFPDDGVEPDEIAAPLHTQAFQIIDCTRCANCCKTMSVRFTPDDVERIAAHLGMPADRFIATYLMVIKDDDFGYAVENKPCPFLGPDDRCTIYEVRPTVCREFPHTGKPDFATRVMSHSNNALQCPAVFWIVEQMRMKMAGADRP
ncbi:MAG: YkgJ family cysteine cluster protein [Planctomycetia bacterium]|nr:YkgJ family cysteine cluster protein [Planctomycetia bacterium]